MSIMIKGGQHRVQSNIHAFFRPEFSLCVVNNVTCDLNVAHTVIFRTANAFAMVLKRGTAGVHL